MEITWTLIILVWFGGGEVDHPPKTIEIEGFYSEAICLTYAKATVMEINKNPNVLKFKIPECKMVVK